MDHNLDSQQAIYSFFKMQIRFGVNRFGDHRGIPQRPVQYG